MADSDPLPVYELHDSAALPAGQELLREEKPSSRSVDQIEQVVAAHKEPTGTRFTEFDLFRHGITNQQKKLLTEKLRALHSRGYTTPYSTPPPDLEYLAQKCLTWMVNQDFPHHETNLVSQLTSHALTQALEGSLDRATISTFQDFVLATTLAYTAWRDQRSPPQRLSVHDLHRASYVAGSSLLQRLDHHLDSQTLDKAPRPTLQALLLVLFGTTLGVAYSTQAGRQPIAAPADLTGKFPTEGPSPQATTRDRLCHLLADKLAHLAGLLWGEVDTAATRGYVLDGCLTGRWTRRGRWVWGSLMPHYVWPPPPGDHSTDWLVHRPGGAFQPAPRAALMRCPEVLSPLMPGMDSSDGGKRRSMLVVGPTSHGQHMYARMRTHAGSGGPSLFV